MAYQASSSSSQTFLGPNRLTNKRLGVRSRQLQLSNGNQPVYSFTAVVKIVVPKWYYLRVQRRWRAISCRQNHGHKTRLLFSRPGGCIIKVNSAQFNNNLQDYKRIWESRLEMHPEFRLFEPTISNFLQQGLKVRESATREFMGVFIAEIVVRERQCNEPDYFTNTLQDVVNSLKMAIGSRNNAGFIGYIRKNYGRHLSDILEGNAAPPQQPPQQVLAFDIADEDDEDFNLSRQQMRTTTIQTISNSRFSSNKISMEHAVPYSSCTIRTLLTLGTGGITGQGVRVHSRSSHNSSLTHTKTLHLIRIGFKKQTSKIFAILDPLLQLDTQFYKHGHYRNTDMIFRSHKQSQGHLLKLNFGPDLIIGTLIASVPRVSNLI